MNWRVVKPLMLGAVVSLGLSACGRAPDEGEVAVGAHERLN